MRVERPRFTLLRPALQFVSALHRGYVRGWLSVFAGVLCLLVSESARLLFCNLCSLVGLFGLSG